MMRVPVSPAQIAVKNVMVHRTSNVLIVMMVSDFLRTFLLNRVIVSRIAIDAEEFVGVRTQPIVYYVLECYFHIRVNVSTYVL